MRTVLIPLAALLALLPAARADAQPSPSETVERLQRAISQGDRAAASATLATNVLIFESGHIERSRDEYLSQHFDSDARFANAVERKVVRRSEQVAGDTALLLAETESSGNFEGRPIKLVGLETMILRVIDGRWQIVHVHWSSRKP